MGYCDRKVVLTIKWLPGRGACYTVANWAQGLQRAILCGDRLDLYQVTSNETVLISNINSKSKRAPWRNQLFKGQIKERERELGK